MQYRELPPPPSLRRHVECVWLLRDPVPADGAQTIWPDGRCELIVHLGAPMRRQTLDGAWEMQSPELFAAQQRAPIRLAATGPLACVGVRLQPAASAAIAGARLATMRDDIIDLRDLDARFAAHLAVAAQALADDGESDTAAPLWRLLERRLQPHPLDARVEAAIAVLAAVQGRGPVRPLAGDDESLRAAQVRFVNAVGLGAKEFARVLRLQATLRALDTGTPDLAALAIDAGFADQAHATRELRQLAGLTPARLARALREERDGDATLRLAAAFVRGGRGG